MTDATQPDLIGFTDAELLLRAARRTARALRGNGPASCDCCGELRFCRPANHPSIETSACWQCLGNEPECDLCGEELIAGEVITCNVCDERSADDKTEDPATFEEPTDDEIALEDAERRLDAALDEEAGS